ncbi:MAG: YcfL family protein [Phycisphaerales bacterium]
MKKYFLLLFYTTSVFLLNGCNEPYKDDRVTVSSGVSRSTLADNILTRPVYGAFTLLVGYGIDLKDVKVFKNEAGFLEIQVTGHNRAVYNKSFDYKVDWIDANGISVDSKAAVWNTIFAKSRSIFSFKTVAPSRDAVDFRMNTRPTPN